MSSLIDDKSHCPISEAHRALRALYIQVPETVADDVKNKVYAALHHLQANNAELKKSFDTLSALCEHQRDANKMLTDDWRTPKLSEEDAVEIIYRASADAFINGTRHKELKVAEIKALAAAGVRFKQPSEGSSHEK